MSWILGRKCPFWSIFLFIVTVFGSGLASAEAASVEKGREVFKLCEGCHSLTPEEHRFGPSLAGLAGRPAGKLKGYQYSDSLQQIKFRWDAKHLRQWLEDEPKNLVPGTRMEFPGINNLDDLKSIVEFLGTLKSR